MEYYEVAEITLNLNSKGYEMGDEESSYMGPDYKKAICACDEALSNWERLDYRDKKESAIEGRIYEIPDDTDINADMTRFFHIIRKTILKKAKKK